MAEKNSLWKNIRNKAKQNRESGATPKKPTTEMLRQERKIKAKKAEGGPVGQYVPSGPGGNMPLDLPLKEQNPYLVPEYNQPMANGYILPDPNRPRVLPEVYATEYKSGIEIDGKEHQVPTIVGGQYIGDHAWDRYNMSGEEFKPMADPSSYSQFYDTIEPLGLMKDTREFSEGGYYPTQGPPKALFKGYAEGGYMYPDGGKTGKNKNTAKKPKPTIVYTDPNLFKIAEQQYQDSLDTYNLSRKVVPNDFRKLPKIDKNKYDEIVKKDKAVDPKTWYFDKAGYDKDVKKNKVKEFKDYMYETPSLTSREIPNFEEYEDKLRIDYPQYNENYPKKYKDADVVEKLKNGVERHYHGYQGEIDKDNYVDVYPNGTERYNFYGDLMWIKSPTIKPIDTEYFGKDEIEEINIHDMSSSSTGWYDPSGTKPKFKNKSNQRFSDTHYPYWQRDIYKEPTVRPVFKKSADKFNTPIVNRDPIQLENLESLRLRNLPTQETPLELNLKTPAKRKAWINRGANSSFDAEGNPLVSEVNFGDNTGWHKVPYNTLDQYEEIKATGGYVKQYATGSTVTDDDKNKNVVLKPRSVYNTETGLTRDFQSSSDNQTWINNDDPTQIIRHNLPEFEVIEEAPAWLQSVRENPELYNGSGRADYVPIEAALLPASLPFQATSRLGKAALFAAETQNPGFGINSAFNKLGSVAARGIQNAAEKLPTGAVRDNIYGVGRGISDIQGGRPFFETFPITKKQRLAVEASQDKAFNEGLDFVKKWNYANNGLRFRPEVKERIKNIYSGPLLNTNSLIKDNPIYTANNLLVNSKRSSLFKNDDISDEAKEYIASSRGRIGGTNMGGTNESITLRNHGLYYNEPQRIKDVAAHELGHSMQKFGTIYDNWGKSISKDDPDYLYRVANTDTPLGKIMGDAMVDPVKGKYTWEASPLEPHSELMVARMKAFDHYKSKGKNDEEIIQFLQNPNDRLADQLIKAGGLDRFFKPTTSQEVKRDIVRALPAVVPAVGIGAGALQQSQEQATGGYTMKNNNQSWKQYLQYKKGGPYKEKEDVFKSPLNEGQTMFQPETQWYKEWINDPEYAARMEKNFKAAGAGDFMEGVGLGDVAKNYNINENKKGIQSLINTTTSNLGNIKTLYNRDPAINESLINQYKNKYGKDPESLKIINKNLSGANQGWTDSENRVVITPTANEMYGPSSVKVHEDTHATGLDAMFKGKFKPTSSQDPEVQKNFRRVEQYPFLMQMRYDQGFKPGEEITPERLKQIRESGYQNHLFKNYTDDEISNYLNTLASNKGQQSNEQYAARGGYYANGGYTNPYNQYQDDPYLQYANGGYMYGNGGRTLKNIGAGAFGVLEGLVDTTFGWIPGVDYATDQAYKGLQKLGGSSEDEIREQDSIHGYGQTAGAVGSAILTSGATTGSAISEGAQGLGQGISRGSETSEVAQGIGKGLNIAGTIVGTAYNVSDAGKASTEAFKLSNAGSTGIGKFAAAAPKSATALTAARTARAANSLDSAGNVIGNAAPEGTKIVTDAAGNASSIKPSVGVFAAPTPSAPNVSSLAPNLPAASTASTASAAIPKSLPTSVPSTSDYSRLEKVGDIVSGLSSLPKSQEPPEMAPPVPVPPAPKPQPQVNYDQFAVNAPTINTGFETPNYDFGYETPSNNYYAAQGGNITNNSLNLRNTMRYKRFAKGGTFDQYGINMIPDSAGLHHESAYGGVPIGPDALAEGGEIKMKTGDGGQYIVSDKVDGAETQKDFMFSKGGKYKELNRTLADGMKQDLDRYTFGSLATSDRVKGDLRRPFDSYSQSTIEQIKNKWQQKTEYARQRSQQEQAIAQAEEQKRMAEEQYIAAYGGKINPKKYPGLNMTKKARGGYVYNPMTQPMLATGGPVYGDPASPYTYAMGGDKDKNKPWTAPIPIGNNIEMGSNNVVSAGYGNKDTTFSEQGMRNIHTYDNGLPNDTSYSYISNRMGANPSTEDFFYNTGQNTQDGKPVSNYNSGSTAPLDNKVYLDRIKKLAGYARGGQIDYTNDMYAGGGPLVGNVPQPFNGPAAQNRGGMLMNYADGGMVSPEQQMMQEQQMQQAPQEQMQQQGGGEEQMMQMVQQVAQAIAGGAPPEQVMQQLVQSGVPPEQAQQVIQAAMQMASQQQPMQQEQQMMPQQGMADGGMMQQQPGAATKIAEALQQGAQPQDILKQLIDGGMPQEQAMAMVQAVMGQLKNQMQQQPQQQMMAPQQPMMAARGGYSYYKGKKQYGPGGGDGSPLEPTPLKNEMFPESWQTIAAGTAQALPGLASAAYSFGKLKDRKLTPNLTPSTTVDYSSERVDLREEGRRGIATALDTMKRNAPTSGSYMSNAREAVLRGNKVIGNQISKSWQNQKNEQAKYDFESGKINADTRNKINEINEGMYQNAIEQGFRSSQDAINKVANYYTGKEGRDIQRWQAQNTNTTNHLWYTPVAGQPPVQVFKNKDGEFWYGDKRIG